MVVRANENERDARDMADRIIRGEFVDAARRICRRTTVSRASVSSWPAPSVLGGADHCVVVVAHGYRCLGRRRPSAQKRHDSGEPG